MSSIHCIIEPSDHMAKAAVQDPCIVRSNGYALKFIPRGYEVVADADATQFTNRALAVQVAREKGLHRSMIEIESTLKKARGA